MKLTMAIGAGLLLLGVGVASSCKDGSHARSPPGQVQAQPQSQSEARRLVAAGATLLDVRLPEEFAEGHIESAINIPVHELERRMSELGPRDRPIVVYCHSGGRSAQAAELLKGASFATVYDLGPMSAW